MSPCSQPGSWLRCRRTGLPPATGRRGLSKMPRSTARCGAPSIAPASPIWWARCTLPAPRAFPRLLKESSVKYSQGFEVLRELLQFPCKLPEVSDSSAARRSRGDRAFDSGPFSLSILHRSRHDRPEISEHSTRRFFLAHPDDGSLMVPHHGYQHVG